MSDLNDGYISELSVKLSRAEDEIERLTALEADYNNTKKACAKLYAEIERLRAENEQLKMGLRALISDKTNGELAKARAACAALEGGRN